MPSFLLTDNKESLKVSLTDGTITLTPVGKEHTRINVQGSPLTYVEDGPQTYPIDATKPIVIHWGVATSEFYDNRRITVAVDSFAYETWGCIASGHGFIPIFTHAFASNPEPSYKIYKYKGAVKAKLQ
jgi:hypothetical protein